MRPDTIINGSSSSTGGSVEEKMKTVMTVAVMVAALSFQVAINPPGGITPDGKAAVMSLQHHEAYRRFSTCNIVAFFLSASTIMLLTCGLPVKRRRWAVLIIIIIWGALSATAAAYMEVVKTFKPVEATETVVRLLKYGMYSWIVASFAVAVVHIWAVIAAIKNAACVGFDFVKSVWDKMKNWISGQVQYLNSLKSMV